MSKLCKFIDEDILTQREDKNWYVSDVDEAFQMIVKGSYTTTLFESLSKNLENNQDMYKMVFDIIFNGEDISYNPAVPVINLGILYGILVNSDEKCKIHNRIFEQRLYDYMVTKTILSQENINPTYTTDYYADEELNVKLVLQKYQEFMKENYSQKDQKFLERQGRLLFLCFLKPIINGKGFDFKEPNIAEERRMDIVITYKNKRYVIELKRWYGEKKHQQGLNQLWVYLETCSLNQGYLLVYNFNKNKEYKQETIEVKGKQIFVVWV